MTSALDKSDSIEQNAKTGAPKTGTVVERVARSIAEAVEGTLWDEIPVLSGRASDQSDWLDVARAAIAAMPEWQPIETAPMNNDHVLLAITDAAGGYVSEGYYEPELDRWYAANTHHTD